MKKIIIYYPDNNRAKFAFDELGLDDNSTEEEIERVADEEIKYYLSEMKKRDGSLWGYSVIED